MDNIFKYLNGLTPKVCVLVILNLLCWNNSKLYSQGTITSNKSFYTSIDDFTFSGTYDNVTYNFATITFTQTDETFAIPTGVAVNPFESSKVIDVGGTATEAWSYTYAAESIPTGYYRVNIRLLDKTNPSVSAIASVDALIVVDIDGPSPLPVFNNMILNDLNPLLSGTFSVDTASGNHSDSIVVNFNGNTYTGLPELTLSQDTFYLDLSSEAPLTVGSSNTLRVITYDTTRVNTSRDSGIVEIAKTPQFLSPDETGNVKPELVGSVNTNGGTYRLDSMRVIIKSNGNTLNIFEADTFTYPSPDASLFTFEDTDTFKLDLATISDALLQVADKDTFNVSITTYDIFDSTNTNATNETFIIDFGDTDGDGISDFIECGDTIIIDSLDKVALCPNTDGIDNPDFNDLDSDNDLIPDSVEKYSNILTLEVGTDSLVDTDGDGLANYRDTDSDGDGILDILEAGQYYLSTSAGFGDTIMFNADLDSLPNHMELDADADFMADTIETPDKSIPVNTDSDPYYNFLDSDSDNDKIADSTETGGDGVPDTTFNDGIPDYLDIDSDDDGILDSIEAKGQHHGTDSVFNSPIDPTANHFDFDQDGIPNYLDLNSDSSAAISQFDAILDTFELAGDMDGDGVPNYLDNDSDGDGLSDDYEFDAFTVAGGGSSKSAGDSPDDFDSNGEFDFRALDSDGDGINDSIEIAGNGTYILGSDSPDNFNDNPGNDGDNFPNHLDLDSDGDSIPDLDDGVNDLAFETEDTQRNYLDLDSDGDGLRDSLESGLYYRSNFVDNLGNSTEGVEEYRDADFDGTVFNHTVLDADDDGYSDATEYDFARDADSTLDRSTGQIVNQPDENDGDGLYDFLDNTFNKKETDPDGSTDVIAIDSTDSDWDSDRIADSDEFNAFGSLTPPPPPYADSDDDGYYNFADLDSDGDNIPDNEENSCTNPNVEGECDYLDDNGTPRSPKEAIGITPNGDGKNDVFGEEYFSRNLKGDFQVFNRWGQVVYEQNPFPDNTKSGDDRFWAGINNNGDPLPTGTYFYIINFTDENGKSKTNSNYIHINR